MSIGIFDKKYQEIKPDLQIFEDSHILTNLSIPFSIMFKKNRTPDIYNGEEIISFDNRDVKFKKILLNEFLIN